MAAMKTSNMTPWRRVLLSTVVWAAVAFGFGFISGNTSSGLAQPGLLLLAVPAVAVGILSRRMFIGAAVAPVLGVAGTVGMVLGMLPGEEHFFVCVGVFTGLGGLVCLTAGALAGLIVDVATGADDRPSP